MRWIVQASSRSWSGGEDLCMRKLNSGKPVVWRTVENILHLFLDADVWVAAPRFDLGKLDFLAPGRQVRSRVYYDHDESPLQRLVACSDGQEYVARIDGLNFCAQVGALPEMLKDLQGHIECVSFPDDWPAQLSFEIWRTDALSRLVDSQDASCHIHPRFFARHRFVRPWVTPWDTDLKFWREVARPIYSEGRQEVNTKAIPAGDQLSFHYELACREIGSGKKVLDLGCGDGYGSEMLHQAGNEVVGVDSSLDAIVAAHDNRSGPDFLVRDVCDTILINGHYDAVTCMEVIEHLEKPTALLEEIQRLLKPDGILVLSTPQNQLGHIPINSAHVREYSLAEIKELVGKYFEIMEVIGIKAGRVVFPNDPIGTNTVLVCRKDESCNFF